jgi:VCBS repeat-containing protein
MSGRTMRRKQFHRSFQVEALEPRQMMAADALNDAYTVTAGRPLNVDSNLTGYSGGQLQQITSFAAPGGVAQMEYSPEYGVVLLRNSGSAIHVIDVATRLPLDTRLATWKFTDMDLSPDGRYLFAADYGGENTGYGTPTNPHHVHRLDLSTMNWEQKLAPKIASRIEAVSDRQVLLQESDQHIDITLNDFGAAAASPMTELSRVGGQYVGDIEYDHRSGRAYHGSSGSSSAEIRSRPIVNNSLGSGTHSGTYGTADGFGGSVALSSDGDRLYYGRLQVEADDITNNLRVFPEQIYAATPRLAFGQNGYYDADTGALRGNLGFATQVYSVSDDGRDIWAFDDAGDKLYHYRTAQWRSGVLLNDLGQGNLTAQLATEPQHGDLTLRADGSFTYVADAGFLGADSFTYTVRDGAGTESTAEVQIAVQQAAQAPRAVSDDYTTPAGQPLIIGNNVSYDLPELVPVSQFRAPGGARKLVYADQANMLLMLSDMFVRVIDVRTEREVLTHAPVHQFTDMDLSPDGRYLYAADYGGTNTGYGTPTKPHYVHRLDLTTLTWETKQAPTIAHRIEAVDGRRFLLQEIDQHVDVMLNDFGATASAAITQLSQIPAGYNGDLEYDPLTGRIYHGTSGSSSSEIQVRKLVGNSLTNVGSTGTYGTAQGHGGSVVLSSDRSRFYYGRLQVDALDVRSNLNLFPEAIHAASSGMAFGSQAYYDAKSSEARGRWGFTPSLLTVSADGEHVWAFNPEGDVLHHYRIVPVTRLGLLLNDRDADADTLTATVAMEPQHGTLNLNADGTFNYQPDEGFAGLDVFSYTTTDPAGQPSVAHVTINVTPTPQVNVAPQATDDSYQVLVDQSLVVGDRPWLAVGSNKVFSFNTSAEVLQIEYSPQFDLVFARTANQVRVYDGSTGASVATLAATNTFSDMDLTFDGRYLFAADYGGENIGYGTPAKPHYVHRYDLAVRAWDVQYLPTVVHRIEAVDRNHVLVQERDQHVDITYNYFSDWPNAPMEELSRISADYYGDFEYDPRTGFMYHGSTGSSSHEIHARRLLNGTLISGTNSGVYGSAQDYEGSSVLSADGKRFYYGKLQVEALNVANNLRVFAEPILAATAEVAFGKTGYYDANTGARLGDVGFQSNVWFVSDDGGHVWAADTSGKLHHFDIRMLASGVLLNDVDPNGDELRVDFYNQPLHGTVSVDPSGGFRYTPTAGYIGPDEFSYRIVDASGLRDFGTVRIDVTTHIELELELRLDNLTVDERVAGAAIGQLSVSGANPGDDFAFTVSDGRFEVVNSTLRLKADVSLDASLESAVSLTVTAINGEEDSVSETFQLTVVANELPWQNDQLPSDVDNDGEVIPLDALLIINELNFGGARKLDWAAQAQSLRYLDTSGDGYVTAIDALIVINFLHYQNRAEGEASISSVEPVSEPNPIEVPDTSGDAELAWWLPDDSRTTRKHRPL